MTNNMPSVNSPDDDATPFGSAVKVSRHHDATQSAAMNAAVMIGAQYSPESKSKFRRECLDQLKASLASARDVSA